VFPRLSTKVQSEESMARPMDSQHPTLGHSFGMTIMTILRVELRCVTVMIPSLLRRVAGSPLTTGWYRQASSQMSPLLREPLGWMGWSP
jgi:hypothetical protein